MLGFLPNPWLILGVLAGLAVAFLGGISTANKWNKVAELRAQVADFQQKQAQSLAAQHRIQEQADAAVAVIDSLEDKGKDLEQEMRDATARADAADAAAAKAIAAVSSGTGATPVSACPAVRSCSIDPALADRLRNATPIGRKARVPVRAK